MNSRNSKTIFFLSVQFCVCSAFAGCDSGIQGVKERPVGLDRDGRELASKMYDRVQEYCSENGTLSSGGFETGVENGHWQLTISERISDSNNPQDGLLLLEIEFHYDENGQFVINKWKGQLCGEFRKDFDEFKGKYEVKK